MSRPSLCTPCLRFSKLIGQGPPRSEPQPVAQHSTSIHILDDDSLTNIFYLYRLALSDERRDEEDRILEGGDWDYERWWYKLIHVCRRWRYLVLGSPSHLDLCLLCTYGTLVADMLAHSPPLPLIIHHYRRDGHEFSSEDEGRTLLALRHRHRVRRIRLLLPISNPQKLIMTIDGEFPMLQFLYIKTSTKYDPNLILPKTFQAPRLQHFIMSGSVICPIEAPLVTSAVGLVILLLRPILELSYPPPDNLLMWLSLLPQLEIFGITFSPNPETHYSHMPTVTHVTLPKLRWFEFKGFASYLEALLPHITAPRLEKFQIELCNANAISIPSLHDFVLTTGKLRFNCAKLIFEDRAVALSVQPPGRVRTGSFYVQANATYLNTQVAKMARISNGLRTIHSAVEYLTLEYRRGVSPPGPHSEAGRTQWRELLRPFGHLKVLKVPKHLILELSRSLQPEDGESPLELLPELNELSYPASDDTSDAFAAFIDARQNAGRPVSLVLL